MITQLKSKSQITLPGEIIKKLKLKAGDNLDIAIEGDTIVIKPVLIIERSQAWFWSDEWQNMEHEATEDIEQRRIHKANTVAELITKLNS